ncbi:MAG: hypothetical protein JNL68_04450 [Burkholderiales bacterium]|nr:hypothetical protein [Burkholderiales bacterium]
MASTFVVDRNLGAVPVTRLLDVRTQLRVVGTFEQAVTDAADRPILAGGQTLEPGALYPAQRNASLRFYLPLYQVSTDARGQPAVELRYAAEEANEVGRLTITLTWTLGMTVALEKRVMDHIAALSLRYRVAVQGGAADGAGEMGTREQTVPLQPLQQLGNQLARSTTIFTDKALFDTVYQAMGGAQRSATLDLQIMARVGMRTWRQVIVGRPGMIDQAKVLEGRGALFTDMVQRESWSTMRRDALSGSTRVKMMTVTPEEQVRVEATRAVIERPETRRMMAERVGSPVLRERTGAPRVAMMTRPASAVRPVAPITDTTPAAATLAQARLDAIAGQPRVTAATLSRVNAPRLSQAVAESDLEIAGRRAVPIQVALDRSRRPAIVDATLENRQSLPFVFDPALNKSVFAVEGFDPGGIHLLLPLRLATPDGSTHIVYQDNLMRDVVHVTPSEFRLERDPTAPFLPALSFLASEFGTTDNDEDADVLFRVAAVYRLEPWLDPDVVELARAELTRQGLVARFMTSVSQDAKLMLDLDLLGAAQQRAEAQIDPDTGITDTLDLDQDTFVRLWRERLANPSGGGVTGRVDFRLFDGSPAQVPVRLSLWETSAELFDVSFVGPVPEQPACYRVLVRNRVESPAWITGLPAEALAGGGIAYAKDVQSVVGQLVQPKEAREIDYCVQGSDAPVAGFEPTVIGRPEPNLAELLKQLMLTAGAGARGFALTVKAVAGAFAAPAGSGEPLTGLLVEFDDGTRVSLSSAVPQAEVTLAGRFLDQILGTADASQRYFYRVTNLHARGEGARTDWREGQGTAPLEVGTAVVRLDF